MIRHTLDDVCIIELKRLRTSFKSFERLSHHVGPHSGGCGAAFTATAMQIIVMTRVRVARTLLCNMVLEFSATPC